MTDPSLPSDRMRSGLSTALDELPQVPDVAITGPINPERTVAAVDGVAIIFFDPASRSPHLVFVSEGLGDLLGYRPDELLGQSPTVLFSPGEAAAEMAAMTRALIPPEPGATPPPMPPPATALDQPNAVPPNAVPPDAVPPNAPAPNAVPPNAPAPNAVPSDAVPPDAGATNADRGSVTEPPSLEFDGWGPDATPAIDLAAIAEPSINLTADLAAIAGPSINLTADVPAIEPAPSPENGTDGQPAVTEAPSTRRYSATQSLLRHDGSLVLVHATHTPIPSLIPAAPYVVVQYRDLGRASAETLLADQAAVVGSLSRGHELGRLCHQVSAQVEQDLPAGSQCWLAIAGDSEVLEPVIAGELPFDTVAEIMRIVAESGTDNMKRVVSVDGLPGEFIPILQARAVKALWYVPMIGSGGNLRGAMMIATDDSRPTQAITKTLDHLAVVMTTAIEHATAEADIAHQRLHDPLTHLPNRALLVDRLGQSLARLERDGIALSVLLVDIDRFRSVNDTKGVEVGDQVLLEVAGRLLAAVRLGDTVGRISSDQFLIMCVATSGELDAAAVARRVLRSLAEPIRIADGSTLHITASVGVVVVDEPGPSPAAVISNAESALARATASGRGQMAMFEADLRRHVVDRHETEQALHLAITQDELVIHYQPLVEIRTGYMVGAEALVRWDRPGFGLLYPPSFIQIAEESDLILPMGNWIIDKVCSDLGQWPKSNGRSPMVTINLAAAQLAVDTLVPTVVSALQRNNLHPTRVGFEITESMEIRDLEAAGVNLNRLSELGCRIAIDDFGIGHATLDYIRQFSMANALKIDRSFVAGLENSKEDTAIVNASIALASSLGLQVIAEGVENLEQLTALEELGCRYAQGFALAKPMPMDEVLELWEKARLYEPDRL
ncbi:MAG: EAL domain-containing protein [Actinomycetota bacterium]